MHKTFVADKIAKTLSKDISVGVVFTARSTRGFQLKRAIFLKRWSDKLIPKACLAGGFVRQSRKSPFPEISEISPRLFRVLYFTRYPFIIFPPTVSFIMEQKRFFFWKPVILVGSHETFFHRFATVARRKPNEIIGLLASFLSNNFNLFVSRVLRPRLAVCKLNTII